jgi:homocysteine S-methyltransferase
MPINDVLHSSDLVLMEGSVIELLRRSSAIELHATLLNSPLVLSSEGRTALTDIYHSYLQVALEASLPILLQTPTWRANRDRLQQAGLPLDINQQAVKFLSSVRAGFGSPFPVFIGGLIGCANDCYQPSQSLAADQAALFHTWQIENLAKAGVDYLLAATIPSLSEATGIAMAMSRTNVPYIISFVINRNGQLLDGNDLSQAISSIDDKMENVPTGYMINCAYPTFLKPSELTESASKRLIGFQANASSLDHSQLDEAKELHVDPIEDWTAAMLNLNRNHQIPILGGCCGTSDLHIKSLTIATNK